MILFRGNFFVLEDIINAALLLHELAEILPRTIWTFNEGFIPSTFKYSYCLNICGSGRMMCKKCDHEYE